MNEELKRESAQTEGEVNAQNETPGEPKLEEAELQAGQSVPEAAGGGPTAADAGAQSPAADEGASGAQTAAASEQPDGQKTSEASAAQTGEAAQPDPAEAQALERGRIAADRLGAVLLRNALEAAGIPKERLDRAARLIDAGDVDPLDDGAAQRYAEKASALIREIPELLPAPTGTTGSSGEHARRQQSPEADTAARFRRGMRR